MKITPKTINRFMFFKLPLGYLSGMRVKSISDVKGVVQIKHRWINQNPFRSIFWAAQGMAAEMATAVLVMQSIQQSNKKISMLVTNQKATFTKKAVGTIVFTCDEGVKVSTAINEAITTDLPQTVILSAEGINSDGVVVSKFEFEWSLKVKS